MSGTQPYITQGKTNHIQMGAEKKCNEFKVGGVVPVKSRKANKASPFHPNLLLGKITEIENKYAQVVTKFGKMHFLIISSN